MSETARSIIKMLHERAEIDCGGATFEIYDEEKIIGEIDKILQNTMEVEE